MGVHQRIDRLAKRSLKNEVGSKEFFPTIRTILHFEGHNGPDGIKRKSPGRDEPWHFIDPKDVENSQLLVDIENHIHNLAVALAGKDEERSGFEAAWLAHAVTDGLTPAHQFPLGEKIAELRGSDDHNRTSVKDKIVLPGTNKREQLRNNWKYWGTKGLAITHYGFEHGVMTALGTRPIALPQIHHRQFVLLKEKGYAHIYSSSVSRVASLSMYEEFTRRGWTRKLARQTVDTLIPVIIEAVTLAWYEAVLRSKELE